MDFLVGKPLEMLRGGRGRGEKVKWDDPLTFQPASRQGKGAPGVGEGPVYRNCS